MKPSIHKRLQSLEQAASGHDRVPLVLIDVTKLPAADREAYWAGDVGILRRYGSPDPAGWPQGEIHTLVIDVHPACRGASRRLPTADDDGDVLGD